jgi:transcriptional regulator with XRE-family HTH domain
MDDVGVRLKQLREAKNLSLRKLAKLANISHSFIADIESGRSNPSLDTLKSLAKALNVSIVDLTGDVKHKDATETHRRIEEALAGYPDADALLAFWKELKEREDLFLLFKQVRPLSDDSIRRVIRVIKAIEDEEAKEFGDGF